MLELLTIQAGLLKTMLTVFKHNTKAVAFFKEVLIQSNKPPQRSTALLMIEFNFRVSNTVWMRLHRWTQFRSNRIRKQSLIIGQNQLFGFDFINLVIIELFQKPFFHRSSLTTRSWVEWTKRSWRPGKVIWSRMINKVVVIYMTCFGKKLPKKLAGKGVTVPP